MAELVALLPLIQLEDRVGTRAALLWVEAEVAQAVLGVLVLAEAAGGGALARCLWQCLVDICGGELVLRWRRAAREGVVSGGGAAHRRWFIKRKRKAFTTSLIFTSVKPSVGLSI